MKKIKISQNILTGAPLSDEDLKLIIGGNARLSRTCKCTYFDEHGGSSTEPIQAESESVCRRNCTNNCNNNPKCVNAAFEYNVMG